MELASCVANSGEGLMMSTQIPENLEVAGATAPDIENQQSAVGSPASSIPYALERSEIPLYFRQFRNAAVLKKLAHTGKGPLYQLVGKKAWYETADIIAWLANRKRSGPQRTAESKKATLALSLQKPQTTQKKRGRPTKAAQWRQSQAHRIEP